jgi:DNA modification methylase
MVLSGWKVFPLPLIWYKASGALPLPKHGPRRTYECILYAYKGDRETIVVKNDVIVKIPPVDKLLHGAQKPVALYRDLLSRSANPGDHILDFMGGSGPILVAANLLKLTATYIEEKKEHFDVAIQRATTMEIDDGAEEDDGLNIEL